MIQLNITALVELTHLVFYQPCWNEDQGGVINVSSIGGFQPMPYWSVYAASKAFVLSFSEALWAEVKDQGVKVWPFVQARRSRSFLKIASSSPTMPTWAAS